MENNNFKIGQSVICINDKLPAGFISKIKKGDVYKIKDITKCNGCGADVLILSNIPEEINKTCILCGSTTMPSGAYYQYRFAPFNYDIIPNHEIIKEVYPDTIDVVPKKQIEKIN